MTRSVAGSSRGEFQPRIVNRERSLYWRIIADENDFLAVEQKLWFDRRSFASKCPDPVIHRWKSVGATGPRSQRQREPVAVRIRRRNLHIVNGLGAIAGLGVDVLLGFKNALPLAPVPLIDVSRIVIAAPDADAGSNEEEFPSALQSHHVDETQRADGAAIGAKQARKSLLKGTIGRIQIGGSAQARQTLLEPIAKLMLGYGQIGRRSSGVRIGVAMRAQGFEGRPQRGQRVVLCGRS